MTCKYKLEIRQLGWGVDTTVACRLGRYPQVKHVATTQGIHAMPTPLSTLGPQPPEAFDDCVKPPIGNGMGRKAREAARLVKRGPVIHQGPLGGSPRISR